jgi:hypothetical protein
MSLFKTIVRGAARSAVARAAGARAVQQRKPGLLAQVFAASGQKARKKK